MPWVKRVAGLVRAVGTSKSQTRTEWLDEEHQDLIEYEAYLEDQSNPTPDKKAERILKDPRHQVIFKALFKLENRVRSLEGLLPLTASEYKDMAKASYFEEIL